MVQLAGNTKSTKSAPRTPVSNKKASTSAIKKSTPAPRTPVTINKASGQRQQVSPANSAAAAAAAAKAIQAASQAANTGKVANTPTLAQQAQAGAFNAQQAGADRIAASNLASAVSGLASSPTPSGSYVSGSSAPSGAQSSAPIAARAPVAPAEVTAPAAPVQSIPTPQVTAEASGGGPSNVQSFTTVGGNPGTYGYFQRKRLNRGPRTGTSVTPELLRRIAAQRISQG